MSKESIGGVVFETPQEEESVVSNIDLSKISKDFLLSRIDVTSNETTKEAVFSEEDIANLRKTLGVEEIPEEDQKKFGMLDHELHEEHLRQAEGAA